MNEKQPTHTHTFTQKTTPTTTTTIILIYLIKLVSHVSLWSKYIMAWQTLFCSFHTLHCVSVRLNQRLTSKISAISLFYVCFVVWEGNETLNNSIYRTFVPVISRQETKGWMRIKWHDNVCVCLCVKLRWSIGSCIISHLNNFLSSPLFCWRVSCVSYTLRVCVSVDLEKRNSFLLSSTFLCVCVFCTWFYLSNLLTIILFFFFSILYSIFISDIFWWLSLRNSSVTFQYIIIWLSTFKVLILCEKDTIESNKRINEPTEILSENLTYGGLIVFSTCVCVC